MYEFSARDISSKMQFEIILTMEGITPETGNTIQVFFMMVMPKMVMLVMLSFIMFFGEGGITSRLIIFLLLAKNSFMIGENNK